MEEQTIPPSPNWYQSTILDVSVDGNVTYGSKNNIVLLSGRDIHIISAAHRDRVSSVVFGPGGEHQDKVASIGGDNIVKIWDTLTRKPHLVHQSHADGVKLMGIDWSLIDTQLVASVDDGGRIVMLDVASRTTRCVTVYKLHATVLACCSHDRQLVAVGDTAGLVHIISTAGGGSVLHKMRGHDTTVVSLSWSPSAPLLASGSKGRGVYVWGADGKCHTILELPNNHQQPQQQQHSATPSSGWVAVCWARQGQLITGSLFGETLVWDVNKFDSGQVKASCRLLSAVHARGLFSIACTKRKPSTPSGDNWRNHSDETQPMTVWTTGQDRLLVSCDLVTTAVTLTLPTIGGFVYCLAASRLDTHKVACGAGDGTIRLWNLACATHVDIKLLWNKINGKVTALSWHPCKETWLAYGTSEGRVGVYDTANAGKGPLRLWSNHKNTVYALHWGPTVYKQGEDIKSNANILSLFSCGDGHLFMYNPDKREQHCVNVLQGVAGWTKKMNVTDFAWKQDNSILAVGTDSGSVVVLQPPHLTMLATVFPHKKMIQSMAWHPLTTASHPDGAPMRHLMAFAATTTEVKVYDFAPLFKGVATETCVATLRGHGDRVTCVAWSPHMTGQLVSTSYDNMAHVWDVTVPGGKLLAVYTQHAAWVYCCLWNPLDVDQVLTGSGDFSLRLWRISKQQITRPAKRAVPAPAPTAQPLQPAAVLPSVEKSLGTNSISTDSTTKKSYFPLSSRARNSGKEHLVKSTYALIKAIDLRSVSQEDLVAGDMVQLGAGDTAPVIKEDMAHLGFFTDTSAMEQLLKLEERQLAKTNNVSYAQEVHLWQGASFMDVLEQARREKKLTNWHIAMAPLVSPRVWREMCTAYGYQLAEVGRHHEAVAMLLAVRQVKEAVELLATHKLFREAVAIARCQLHDNNVTANIVVAEWAEHADKAGDYELAVHCLISLGEYERAAMVQGCRRDAASLELAAHLAQRAGAHSLTLHLAQQAVHKYLLDEQYEAARVVTTTHQQLQTWLWLIASYELLTDLLKANTNHAVFSSRVWSWMSGNKDLTRLVPDIATKCLGVPTDNAELMLRALETNPVVKTLVCLTVAGQLAVASMHRGEQEQCCYYVQAMATAYHYETRYPHSRMLLSLATWLPQEIQEMSVAAAISVCAYTCAGIAQWLETQQHYSLDIPSENIANLLAVLSKTLPAALDADTMFYYQACAELERCQLLAAEANSLRNKLATRNDVIRGLDNGTLSEKEVKLDNKNGESGQVGISNNEVTPVNGVREGSPSKKEVEQDSVVDVTKEVSLLGNGVALDNVVGELDKVSLSEKAVTLNNVVGVANQASVCTSEAASDNTVATAKMMKLQEFKNGFIASRVSAPNPFSVYVKLKAVLEKESSKLDVAQFLNTMASSWTISEASVKVKWSQMSP